MEDAHAGRHRFHAACNCAQHKTGNAVQLVSEYLGLIRPGFALASCLATGSISDDLDCELRAVLDQELNVIDPAVALFDAPDSTQQIHMLRELFEVCYVQASGRGDDLERKQRAEVEDLDFMWGILWRSPPARVPPRLLQPRVRCAGR